MKETEDVEETLKRYLLYAEQVTLASIYHNRKPLHQMQRQINYWSKQLLLYEADQYASQALAIYLYGKYQCLSIETILSRIEKCRLNFLRECSGTNQFFRQPNYQCYVYCGERDIKLRLLFKYIGSIYIRELLFNLRSAYRKNRTLPTILPISPSTPKSSGRIAPAA